MYVCARVAGYASLGGLLTRVVQYRQSEWEIRGGYVKLVMRYSGGYADKIHVHNVRAYTAATTCLCEKTFMHLLTSFPCSMMDYSKTSHEP